MSETYLVDTLNEDRFLLGQPAWTPQEFVNRMTSLAKDLQQQEVFGLFLKQLRANTYERADLACVDDEALYQSTGFL